jgi:hypothetical protein
MKKLALSLLLLHFFCAMSGQSEEVYNTFLGTRLVNQHTIRSVEKGVGQLRFSHRFGSVRNGFYNLYGLDQATVRIGFAYGVSDKLMVGMGRSTYERTWDAFAKYALLEQKTSGMPISLSYVVNTDVFGEESIVTDRFSSRLSYTHQLLIARKFNDYLSLQLNPTFIHKNLVTAREDPNDHVGIAGLAHVNLSRVVSVHAEYFLRLNGTDSPTFGQYYNSLALGVGFYTKGHYFSLHFANSGPTTLEGSMLETSDSWGDGAVRFGFNLVRNFQISKK